MTSHSLSVPRRSVLVVIDFQEAFRGVLHAGEQTESRIVRALRGASIFGVPALLTEHYPKGLGTTTPAVLDAADDVPKIEKTAFGALREPSFVAALAGLAGTPDGHGPSPEIVLAGIETHICVLQTAFQLRERGYLVSVLADAVTARDPDLGANGLAQMAAVGVRVTNTESLLFEWCGEKANPGFRRMQALLKES